MPVSGSDASRCTSQPRTVTPVTEILVSLVSALLVAGVTKWLSVGGRERRSRDLISAQLALLTGLKESRRGRPEDRKALAKQIDARVQAYVEFTASRAERIIGWASLGIAIVLGLVSLPFLAAAGAVPTGALLYLASLVFGICIGLFATLLETIAKAVRRRHRASRTAP